MDAYVWPRHYRTVFISDVHLGTRGCQAEALLAFLQRTRCDHLYLVGDIIDMWQLRKNWYWPETHNACVQEVLGLARNGTRVTYVPGNHDEGAREYCGLGLLNGIEMVERTVHETADGRRMLVIHGDEFDGVVKYARWLAFLGDTAYHVALVVNRWFNFLRRRLGYPYWSLSAYLKNVVKNAVEFISDFETALADEARRHGADGVICGHIHHAEIKPMNGVLYCNDGDWVESLTALVEHEDGRFEVIRWREFETVTAASPQFALAS